MGQARRMPQLAQCLRLNLADAFASHLVLAADLFEGAFRTVEQTEAIFQHFALAFGQRAENGLKLFLEETETRHLRRIFRAFVLDEITEAGVAVVADWSVQRNRLMPHLQERVHAE